MALFGSKQKDWSEANLNPNPPEDLFHCKNCNLEFSLESEKIKGKKVVCPLCLKNLEAWQKEWAHS